MNPRFYCPPAALPDGQLSASCTLLLPEAVAHHACRVLRLPVGASITLFDGTGREFPATLLSDGKKATAAVGIPTPGIPEPKLEIWLVQALASADKMDWIIQKAVELGVTGVMPVSSERTVLRLTGERAEKRQAHWEQIVVAACEQCGRNRLPTILPIQPFSHYLTGETQAVRYLLNPTADQTFRTLAAPTSPLHLLVGPEGGWSDTETDLAIRHGVIGLRLGPRVLRTETAGLSMIAALQAVFGDF